MTTKKVAGRQPSYWGSEIRKLRSEKGLSQRQLAVLAGVNRSTMRRLEEGSGRSNIDLLEKLLLALGYELEALQLEALKEQARRRAALAADPEARSQAAHYRLLTMMAIRGPASRSSEHLSALDTHASPLAFQASS